MKIMKYLEAFAWSGVAAFAAFFIADYGAEAYAKSLKATGELVTAKDILGIKLFPRAIAIICGGYVLSYFLNKK